MIKIINNKAVAIRCWWTNYIYWIPTIQTELHLLPNSCLTNFNIKNVLFFEGNNFSVTFNILGVVIVIDYWWKLKER